MTAPIIVSATFGAADAALLDNLRRTHFPPERNHLAAHLTLFHHLPPSVAPELQERLRRAVREAKAAPAWLAGIMDLGGGTALRVRSSALEAIRADLADTFAAMLVPQDRAGWRPHVTIQNKVPREAATTLQRSLAGRYDERPLVIAGLAAWWYRGGPWEPLTAVHFRD